MSHDFFSLDYTTGHGKTNLQIVFLLGLNISVGFNIFLVINMRVWLTNRPVVFI